MQWLDKLDRRFGRFAIPNLTAAIIAGQVGAYLLWLGKPEIADSLQLVPERLWQGQWWLLLTAPFSPPATHPLFALLFWYFFFFLGTALEGLWGHFRYNVYLLIGYVATVAAGSLTPELPVSNGFLFGSVFLAFAFLFPDFEILLFFILPVKIRWLALIAWIFFGLTLLQGEWSSRFLVLASVLNFLVFFGRDILERGRARHRLMSERAREVMAGSQPFHRCCVCGITDKTHPQVEFRYCSKCVGQCGYCPEHLPNHQHVVVEAAEVADRPGG